MGAGALLTVAGLFAQASGPGATTERDSASTTADAAPEEAGAVTEEIVVTAGRSEQKVRDVPVKVSVITRREIERSPAQSTDDLLRDVPSFSTQRSRSSRVENFSGQSVAYRGLGGNSASRALVLVDGVPLNEPFAGWINWSRIPPFSVERIELVPAGGSGAWGNQALGGVIQVITRRPEPGSVLLQGQVGSDDTREATVFGSDVRGPWAYAGWINDFHTDGYFFVPEEVRGPVDLPVGSDARVIDGRLEHTAESGRRLVLQANDVGDDRVGEEPLFFEQLDLTSARAGLDWVGDAGGAWRADLFALRRRNANSRGSVDDDRVTVEPRRSQFDNPSDSLGAGLSWTRALGDHLLTAGLDAQRTDSEVNEDSDFADGFGFTRRFRSGGEQTLAGVYVQDSALLSPRWRLSAGGRIDRWRSSDGLFFGRDLVTGEGLFDDRLPARSETVFSPNLGARFNASDRLQVRGALFQSFRAPSPNELFKSSPSSRSFLAANNRLDPERVVLGAETGFDWSPSRRLLLRLTGFWHEIEDQIVDVTIGRAGDRPEVVGPCGLLRAGGRCRQRGNLEGARSRGAELDVEVRPHRSLRLAARYAYTDAEVTEASSAPELVGLWIRRVPEHQASVQLEYTHSRVGSAALSARYLGERWEEDLNTELIEDSFQVDLRLSRALVGGLDAYLVVENVFDEEIATAYNDLYQELGQPRWFHLGLRYRWRAR